VSKKWGFLPLYNEQTSNNQSLKGNQMLNSKMLNGTSIVTVVSTVLLAVSVVNTAVELAQKRRARKAIIKVCEDRMKDITPKEA